eukprot:4372500-Alexandrium_andersonii.AAC.1
MPRCAPASPSGRTRASPWSSRTGPHHLGGQWQCANATPRGCGRAARPRCRQSSPRCRCSYAAVRAAGRA